MAHNRKYVPSSVDLVRCRIRNSHKVVDQNGIEKLIIDSGFLDNAPFKWVGVLYLNGFKNDLNFKKQKIDKKDGELSFEIELKAELLEWADWENLNLLRDIYKISVLDSLIYAGEKYNLKLDLIRAERAEYGNIPETIEECEKYPKEWAVEV